MMGPVEYLIVEFPGNQFKGEIVPALNELISNGTIRILDLIFIRKDADGRVTWNELSALPVEEASLFNVLGTEFHDLMTEEDFIFAAEMLQPDSSAGILLFEHAWATRLRDAIVNAKGRVVDNASIPAAAVEAAMEAALSGVD